MPNGAPPLSISIDGREFQCLNESAGNPEQGGFDSEYQPNGDPSTGRWIVTPTGWSIPDQAIQLDTEQNDWEYLNDKKNALADMDIVITYQDAIYGGTGRISGKLPWDPMAASGSISLMGSGQLQRQ